MIDYVQFGFMPGKGTAVTLFTGNPCNLPCKFPFSNAAYCLIFFAFFSS